MEQVKTKRSLEKYTNRDAKSPFYGMIPPFTIDKDGNEVPTTIDINVYLTQSFDDMGIFTDAPFKPVLPYLSSRPTTLGNFNSFVYGRFPAAPLSFYLSPAIRVEGVTDDSNLGIVESYRVDPNTGNPIYVPNLDMAKNIDLVFNGVTSNNNSEVRYVIGADVNDINNSGVHYITFLNDYVERKDEEGNSIRHRYTEFYTDMDSLNDKNVTLSALTKQEEYLGIVFKPEVDSEVFINRGVADIFERHALLSEIKTTNDIDYNRDGFLKS